MSYEEVLHYIDSTIIQFGKKGGQAFHKGFEKIQQLIEMLNHPEQKLNCIHVAGTNGKGSTCTILAHYLQSQGLKVGLHTSPHINDMRERFLINGVMISKNHIIDFIEQYRSEIEIIKPSYFELTVAMAIYFFHQEHVDIAIMETGLGGRYDSTNIVKSILSIITNISIDHVAILGDNVSSIAYEKAGIIKEGTPIILGLPEKEEATSVIEKEANLKNAPLYKTSQLSTKALNLLNQLSEELSLPYFQKLNIKTVYQAILQLKDFNISKDIQDYINFLKHFFHNNNFQGRWQTLQHQPRIILDVGHNEAALEMQQMELQKLAPENLHIIIGFMVDKEVADFLKYFPKNAQYYFTQASIERAMPAHQLMGIAEEHQLIGRTFTTTQEAWQAVQQKIKKEDTLLVTGSFFIIDDFLKAYHSDNEKSPK